MIKKKAAKKTATKAVAVRKVKRVELELFLQALTDAYYKDALAPGVTVAWLPSKGQWYASICRCEVSTVKRIVMSVYCEKSLACALYELSEKWKQSIQPRKQNYLEDFLK